MKNYIKQVIKIKISNFKEQLESVFCKSPTLVKKGEKYAFIFLAADYNNLGDIAITIAQFDFLKKLLNNYRVICIAPSDTVKYCKSIKKISKSDVLVTIIGGGNNGSLYEFLERPRRYILRTLKDYKIVSFPQTVFFESTEKAYPYKKEFIKVVNQCSNLTLFARENYSFKKYNEMAFKSVNIELCPDIVFSLKPPRINNQNGKSVAIILRDDKEKNVSCKSQSQILDFLKRNDIDDIEVMDTWGDNNQHYDNDTLNVFLKKLSYKRIVITDRLHGMIFCYITQTPCLVVDSSNPKIVSTYDTWLKSCNFIRLCNPNMEMDSFISNFNDLYYKNIDIKKSELISYTELVSRCKEG